MIISQDICDIFNLVKLLKRGPLSGLYIRFEVSICCSHSASHIPSNLWRDNIDGGSSPICCQTTHLWVPLPPPSYSSHTPQSAGNRGGGLVTHGYHNWPSDVDNHGSLGCVQYVLPSNTQYIVCVGGQKYTILVSLASIIHPLQRLGKSHAHTRKRLPTNKLLQSR